jgi:hypothetical protein
VRWETAKSQQQFLKKNTAGPDQERLATAEGSIGQLQESRPRLPHGRLKRPRRTYPWFTQSVPHASQVLRGEYAPDDTARLRRDRTDDTGDLDWCHLLASGSGIDNKS